MQAFSTSTKASSTISLFSLQHFFGVIIGFYYQKERINRMRSKQNPRIGIYELSFYYFIDLF